MRPEDISVGMQVRIRQWDDMDRESRERYAVGKSRRYTYDPDRLFAGSDSESYVFLERMAYLCGEEFTVADIHDRGRIIPSSCVTENGVRLDEYTTIEAWMVEPAYPAFNEELPEPSLDSLSEFMKGWCRS